MGVNKPTFLIIGAQKCGTTWLHQHLCQHPDIFMPAEKELEFFSYQGHLADPGFAAYLQHFSKAGQAHAVGEATASYFWTNTGSEWGGLPAGFQDEIPKTVQQYLGNELKLIVTLRNPVDRVVSAYLHYLAMGEITPDSKLEETMSYGGIVDMGFYARHLRNWLEYYPLEQIKVLILESDIQARPVETLADTCRFLTVAEHAFAEESVQQTVYPGTQRLVNDGGVFVMDNDQHWRKVISVDSLQQLKQIFLNDVRDLDRIIGTNLVQSWGMTA
jgi:hypothetical protein